jgi:hypothetical protein
MIFLFLKEKNLLYCEVLRAEHNTPSMPNIVPIRFFEVNWINFDQIYTKKSKFRILNQYHQIHHKHILIWYRLGIVDIYNFVNKLSQT